MIDPYDYQAVRAQAGLAMNYITQTNPNAINGSFSNNDPIMKSNSNSPYRSQAGKLNYNVPKPNDLDPR